MVGLKVVGVMATMTVMTVVAVMMVMWSEDFGFEKWRYG
jgi:hypothetical protein